MRAPKKTKEILDRVINAWQTLRPEKSFGGMTLEQFKEKVRPSYSTRERLAVLENEKLAEQNRRDDADDVSMEAVKVVVNGVKGDPDEGPDGELYESFGYVRDSERRSGLTRVRKPKA
jgi:hypothetical protein